jgi:hypothetical protein
MCGGHCQCAAEGGCLLLAHEEQLERRAMQMSFTPRPPVIEESQP